MQVLLAMNRQFRKLILKYEKYKKNTLSKAEIDFLLFLEDESKYLKRNKQL